MRMKISVAQFYPEQLTHAMANLSTIYQCATLDIILTFLHISRYEEADPGSGLLVAFTNC